MSISKWKSALTAEEAALIALEVADYGSLGGLKKHVDYLGEEIEHLTYGLADIEEGRVDPEGMERNHGEWCESYNEALGIYEALLNELLIADPWIEDNVVDTELVLALRAQKSELETYLVPENCTVTKKSLARWFYQHDIEMAKKFDPNIEETIKVKPLNDQIRKTNIINNSKPSTKTVNSYLKIIAALTDALIGGRTGTPNTDAEALLAALSAKNVTAPVEKKTLAKYLKEASEQ
jgi:hypothetical protein